MCTYIYIYIYVDVYQRNIFAEKLAVPVVKLPVYFCLCALLLLVNILCY